jgi:nitroreductase
MSGIVFFKTRELEKIKSFYMNMIGCDLWLDQGTCIILQHGNFLAGFCSAEEADTQGILTYFYPSPENVDTMYQKIKLRADAPPRTNSKFRIYQFFARDPEGRTLEFQYFQHPINRYLTGAESLEWRRSIREFSSDPVPSDLKEKILDICRYAPTSMNSQSCFYKFIDNPDDLAWLADVRGAPSAPIGRATLAVAIVADPEITKRPDQDAAIAAYHFMLASGYHGLGTCWIAAMNRDDVKKRLNIPERFYLSTVTPLGWPKKFPKHLPNRGAARELFYK